MTDRGRDGAPTGLVCYIPVYKPGPHFDAALGSLAASTVRPYLIAVDDGNTPPLTVPFDRYGLSGEVVRLDRNSGVAAAANAGVKRALDLGASHVARLDSDDLVKPDRFRRELDYLAGHPGKLAVFASAEVIDAKGRQIGTWRIPTHDDELAARMIRNNVLCHSTGLFRPAFFDRYGYYDPALRNSEDYALLLEPCLDGTIGTLDELLVGYRVHETSLSFGEYRRQLRLRFALQARSLPRTRMRGLVGLARTTILYTASILVPKRLLLGLRRRFGLSQVAE